jgi:hypothetical protein
MGLTVVIMLLYMYYILGIKSFYAYFTQIEYVKVYHNHTSQETEIKFYNHISKKWLTIQNWVHDIQHRSQ